MSMDSLPCYIYRCRSDESDGETVTIGMMIPHQKISISNHFTNVALLSKERKLNVYKIVHGVLGDPPDDLFLPKLHELLNDEGTAENSWWTFFRWNIEFEEREVISALKSVEDTLRPITLQRIVVPLSDPGFFWICKFSEAIRDLEY